MRCCIFKDIPEKCSVIASTSDEQIIVPPVSLSSEIILIEAQSLCLCGSNLTRFGGCRRVQFIGCRRVFNGIGTLS